MISLLHIHSNDDISGMCDNFFSDKSNIEYISEKDIKNIDENLSERNFDCIIVGCSDTIDPIELYNKIESNLPFLVFTNNGSEELAFRCSDIGISEYVNINRYDDPLKVLEMRILKVVSDRSSELDKNDSQYYFNQITRLQNTISELFEIKDIDNAIDLVRDCFIESFGYPMVGIWIKDGDVLKPKSTSSMSDDILGSDHPNYKKGNSISWESYENNEMKIISNIKSEDNVNNENTVIESEAIIPIDDLGVINIASVKRDAFTETESELMKLWSESFKTALDRIKKRKDLEENRRELIKEKERMSNFVSFVTHDVRNPLQIAKGNIDIMQSEIDHNRLDTVERSLDRIDNIIDDIKVLTEQRKDQLDLDNVNIKDLVDSCWLNIETKDSNLVNEVELEVQADPSKLSNLFENLFKNAVDHGGEDVDIIVGNLNCREGFYVEDSGGGIDEEIIDSIFESGVTTENEGSGFGLKIVSEVVDIHNWEIEPENTYRGARFNIYTDE